MSKEFIFNNIYINVFILFINTSISDAFFESLYIPPSLISIIRLLTNLIFILLTAYYFLTKRIKVRKYLITIIFLLFIGCTLVWTPNKFEALKLYINFLGPCTYFILLFIIGKKNNILKILRNYSILIVFGDIIALTILNGVGYMGEGRSTHIMRGIHLSRSTMVVYLNFCVFVFLYYLETIKTINYKEKYKTIALIIISIILIALTKSSTGLITIVLFIPLLLILRYKKISKIIFKISIVLGIILPLINVTSSKLNNLLVSIFGKSLTFSGRKYIWDYVISKINNNPIKGNGFNSTEYLLKGKVIPIYERVAEHAHNGFLELFLQTGLIGFILLILIIFIAFKCTFKLDKKKSNLIRVYFIIVIVFNFMEPYMINSVSIINLWLPLIFLITLNNRKEVEVR